VPVHAWTAEVLQLAAQLHAQTDGLFDVALGTGRWALQPALPARQQRQQGAGHALIRLDAGTRLDLGGIAKGWAVDQAVRAAQAAGAPAVWVNAGGDLRAQGVAVPVVLRDERLGGVRPWATLQDGAMATSDFALGARSALWGAVACHGRREASTDDSADADADADADAVQQWGRKQPMLHVSVAAPCCAWADALTKIVALAGQLEAPLVQRLLASYQAQAWLHNASPSP
jgi:thiamine biosynthesis lipoprotein